MMISDCFGTGVDVLGASPVGMGTAIVTTDYASFFRDAARTGDDPPLLRKGAVVQVTGPMGKDIVPVLIPRGTPVFSGLHGGGVNYPPHKPIDHDSVWWTRPGNLKSTAAPRPKGRSVASPGGDLPPGWIDPWASDTKTAAGPFVPPEPPATGGILARLRGAPPWQVALGAVGAFGLGFGIYAVAKRK